MCELVELQTTLKDMLGVDKYTVVVGEDITVLRGRTIIVEDAPAMKVIPYLKGISENHKQLLIEPVMASFTPEVVFEPMGFVEGGAFTENSVTKIGHAYNFVGMKSRLPLTGDFEVSCNISSETKDYTYLGLTKVAGISGRALDQGLRVRSSDSLSLLEDGQFEEVHEFTTDSVQVTLRKEGDNVSYFTDGVFVGSQVLPDEDPMYFQVDLYRGKQTVSDLTLKLL